MSRRNIILILCLLFIGGYFLTSADQDKLNVENKSRPSDLVTKTTKLENTKLKDVLDGVVGKRTGIVGKTFERKYPKYNLSSNNYKILYKNMTDMEALKKEIENILPDLSLSEMGDYARYGKVWDLTQTPKNNGEYKSFLKELELLSLYKISNGIQSKNVAEVQLYLGAIQTLNLFAAFDLEKIENGVPHFRFVSQIYTRIEQLEKKRKKIRKIASSETVAGSGEVDEDQRALDLLDKTNPKYFADFKDRDAVDEFYKKEDEVTDSLTNLYLSISEFMANSKFLPEGFQIREYDIYEKTLSIMKKVNNELPGERGAKSIADYSYEVYSQGIGLEMAVSSAIWTASIVAFSDAITTFFERARFFGALLLSAFPPEALISGFHCYHGAINLYKLHLYHSSITKKKEFITMEEEHGREPKGTYLAQADKIAQEESKAVQSVYIDEVMRGQINKSWAWGFVLGQGYALLNRSPAMYDRVLVRLGALDVVRRTSLTALVAKGLVKGVTLPFKWIASNSHKVLNLSLFSGLKSGGGVISKLLNSKYFMPTVSLITSKVGGLALVAVDTVVSSVLSFQLVYTRMHVFSGFISQLYLSPEMSIVLTQTESDVKKDFLEKTRKLFYPVCNHFANLKIRDQFAKLEDEEFHWPEIKKVRDSASLKCISLISIFEGNAGNIAEILAEIESPRHDLKKGRVHEAYYKDMPFSERETQKLVAQMHIQPDHYKIVWLIALRTIFPHKTLTYTMRDFRNQLIYGASTPSSITSGVFHPEKSNRADAIRKNLSNFSYFIDFFAYKLCTEKRPENPEQCDVKSNINMPSAFRVIWQRSVAKGIQANDSYQDYILRRDERPWYMVIKDGTVDGMKALIWSVKNGFSPLVESDYNLNVEKYAKQYFEDEVSKQEYEEQRASREKSKNLQEKIGDGTKRQHF